MGLVRLCSCKVVCTSLIFHPGTDATIATHIQTIIDRQYVMERMHGAIKYLIPSTLGIGLVEGYNAIEFDRSLSKPHLRREVCCITLYSRCPIPTPSFQFDVCRLSNAWWTSVNGEKQWKICCKKVSNSTDRCSPRRNANLRKSFV